MFICICKAVSEKTIRRSVERGDVISLRDLTRETGLGTCCGKCVPAAREALSSVLSSLSTSTGHPGSGDYAPGLVAAQGSFQ